MNLERADEHIRMLRSFLVADRDESLLAAERKAAAAAARGDEWFRKFHQDDADWLRTVRFSWEDEQERDAA